MGTAFALADVSAEVYITSMKKSGQSRKVIVSLCDSTLALTKSIRMNYTIDTNKNMDCKSMHWYEE